MVKKKYRNTKKIIYPMIQGYLKENSETVVCGTGKYKTTFALKELKTDKEYLCVYWANLAQIKKGELALARGLHSAKDKRLFFCSSVHKIPYPYEFGEID